MEPIQGTNRCKGCGEWPGIGRRDWCVDCKRKQGEVPLKSCNYKVGESICGVPFRGSGKATRCPDHKGLHK